MGAKVSVTVVLFAVLAVTTDWTAALASLASTKQSYILAALFCVAWTPVLTTFRWAVAGLASGLRLPHSMLLRATYSAVFVGQFLPAGVGVDSARLAMLWQANIPISNALASIALDRLSGIAAILALTIVGLPFVPALVPEGAAVIVFGVILAGALATTCLLHMDRIPSIRQRRIGRLHTIAGFVRTIRLSLLTRYFLLALGYAALIHLMSIVAVLLVAEAFGHSLGLWPLLTISSLALFASMLPISFNGWGVREGALVIGLSTLHIPRETALLISLVYGVLLVISSLPGGFLLKFGSSGLAPKRR